MIGDVLTVERKSGNFSALELGLLEKVEKERASLLPATVTARHRERREAGLQRRYPAPSILLNLNKNGSCQNMYQPYKSECVNITAGCVSTTDR